MRIVRAMQIDLNDGKPLVGTQRNRLGVRPTDPNNTIAGRQFDVPAVLGTDLVLPGQCKGLSANSNSSRIHAGRKDAIWELDSDVLIQFDLAIELDPADPEHVIIAPLTAMSLDQYQSALQLTRDHWQRL